MTTQPPEHGSKLARTDQADAYGPAGGGAFLELLEEIHRVRSSNNAGARTVGGGRFHGYVSSNPGSVRYPVYEQHRIDIRLDMTTRAIDDRAGVRTRQYRGLLGHSAILVPAIVFGAWRLAGAQDGLHGGDMAPFLVSIAAILVAAKLGGELVERAGQPAVLGELLVGIVMGNFGLTGIELFLCELCDL